MKSQQVFFLKEEDVELDELTVPIFIENPNLPIDIISEKSSVVEYMESIINDSIYKPGYQNKDEIVTKINSSGSKKSITSHSRLAIP